MSTSNWEDRRGLFQRGKDVHEPARRPSQSSGSTGGGLVDAVRRTSMGSSAGQAIEKTLSNSSAGSGSGGGSPTAGRRPSQSGGLFSNLQQHKRGSQDYETRRASFADQQQAGGLVSGWFNSTFRGMKGGDDK